MPRYARASTSHQLNEKMSAQKYGAYDRLFMKHISLQFGEDLELAFRASFFVLLCGGPFMVPKEWCPLCFEIIRTRFYSSTSIVYFMFTLYKTTGDTINFAIGGLLGTFLAVVNIWCMMGFMPGGYHGPDHPDWWIWYAGMLWGMTFVWVILWLNFDGNTQVFALSTYVWYWMAFLNYHVATGFSHGFSINFSGAAVREMMIAASGITLALIASFIPYPAFAIRKARSRGKNSVCNLHIVWTDFVEYYQTAEKNPYKVTSIQNKIGFMRERAGVLEGYIASAWYECFGMGSWQRQRMMLHVLETFQVESFSRLYTALQVSLTDDFGEAHIQIMENTGPYMSSLIRKTGDLLAVIVDSVEVGHVMHKSTLEARIDDVMQAQRDLTKEFIKACQALNLYEVSLKSSSEHVVCSSICSFSRLAQEFGRNILGELPSESVSWRDGGGMLGLFAPSHLFNWMHLNFVLRNWLSICISFWIGYKGVAGKMILPYNAQLASTCCVLLSRFIGSAMANNLNRLQGVVLGTVYGQVCYALLAWCVWWGYIAVAVAVLCWATITLFVYYNSKQYSSVGLLLGVFGITNILQGCSDEIFDPTHAYYSVVNTTSAIVVMCVVDFIFSPGRASDLAKDAYFDVWDRLLTQTELLFSAEEERLPARKGQLRAMIAKASYLGNEAYQEPRHWRAPWPKVEFERAIHCLVTLRFSLACVEANITKPASDGTVVKEAHIIAALKMETFTPVRETLMKALRMSKTSIQELLGNETGIWSKEQQLSLKNAAEELEAASETVFDGFIEEFNSTKKEPAKETLEDDPVSDMSIFVCSLKAIFTELIAANQLLLAKM